MSKRLLAVTFTLIYCLGLGSAVSYAESAMRVYSVLQRGTEYQIVETDLSTQITRTLHVFSSEIAADIVQKSLPTSESALLSPYPNLKGTAYVKPIQIALSPDQTKLALAKRYQLCIHPGKMECFGMSEVSIIDVTSGALSVVWKMGLRSAEWLPKVCTRIGSRETFFEKMAWIPTDHTLVVSITGGPYCFEPTTNHPLVSIDLPSGAVTSLGEAIVWGISQTGIGVNAIERVCEASKTSLSCHHQFEIRTRNGDTFTSTLPIPIETNLTIYPSAELWELNSGIVTFTREMTAFADRQTVELLQFDKTSNTVAQLKFTMPDDGFNGFLRTQISSDRNSLITQSSDKTLWKLSINSTTKQAAIASLLDRPVAAWSVGHDNLILAIDDANAAFEVIDLDGNVRMNISRRTIMEESSQQNIVFFDW